MPERFASGRQDSDQHVLRHARGAQICRLVTALSDDLPLDAQEGAQKQANASRDTVTYDQETFLISAVVRSFLGE